MNRGRVALGALAMLVAGLGSAALPALAQSAAATPDAAPVTLHILYLSREDDPAYQPSVGEDGVARAALPEPFPGAELAVKDTRPTAHAVGVAVTLDRRILAADAPIAPLAGEAADTGAAGVLADLPDDDLASLAKAWPAGAPPLFNIRDADEALRRTACGTSLFHVVPSTPMLTDALVQFIVRKAWRNVLVLRGPLPADGSLADAFTTSAKKFGARIVDDRAFIAGNDPRKREHTDIGLLTTGADYDVLFLADTARDFGRFVPYDLVKPRPVIGTEGLRPEAWDVLAERFGAPQVNNRFARLAHRGMTESDWAAWVAVRAVVEAAVAAHARTGAEVAAALTGTGVVLDVSKGVQSSFRPWDHQLRQAVMLASSDTVIAYAPIEGFLHQHDPLDTLGTDLPESPCTQK